MLGTGPGASVVPGSMGAFGVAQMGAGAQLTSSLFGASSSGLLGVPALRPADSRLGLSGGSPFLAQQGVGAMPTVTVLGGASAPSTQVAAPVTIAQRKRLAYTSMKPAAFPGHDPSHIHDSPGRGAAGGGLRSVLRQAGMLSGGSADVGKRSVKDHTWISEPGGRPKGGRQGKGGQKGKGSARREHRVNNASKRGKKKREQSQRQRRKHGGQ